MRKKIISIAAIFAIFACESIQSEDINERNPQKTDFKERILEPSTVIGSKIDASVQAVDLGLSVKWANVNLGASSPNEQGIHYAWAEIESAANFGWCYYEHNDKSHSCSNILYLTKYCFDKYGEINDVSAGAVLDKLDDAAYIEWGEGWRIPSDAEYGELIRECEWSYDKSSNTFVARGKNGNSIQFPAPGYSSGNRKYSAEQSNAYLSGGYWTRNLSEYSSADAKMVLMTLDSKSDTSIRINPGYNRCFGLPIRAVQSINY